MATHARPLEVDDGPELASIDLAYAEAHGLEPAVTPGSLRFFERAGHAFVAIRGGEAVGFVLAQAVFDGERAVVRSSRLASRPPGDDDALAALLRALTKSAYDAGAYDLCVALPSADLAGAAALAGATYARATTTVFERRLGSRGNAGAAGA